MPDLDSRLIAFALWGLGTVAVYADVLRVRLRSWALHHDRRGKREAMSGLALFLTALCSSVAIFLVLFGQAGSGIRGLFVAIALGAFTGAGIVLRTERPAADPLEDQQ